MASKEEVGQFLAQFYEDDETQEQFTTTEMDETNCRYSFRNRVSVGILIGCPMNPGFLAPLLVAFHIY